MRLLSIMNVMMMIMMLMMMLLMLMMMTMAMMRRAILSPTMAQQPLGLDPHGFD